MNRIYILLFFFYVSISFIACNNKPDIDETKVFRLNRYDNISSLDPSFARTQANNWVCNLMYNSLVKLNDDLEIVPMLQSLGKSQKMEKLILSH